MNEEQSDDRELLRQYLAGSEAAFRELVNRHVGLVQATVRRVLNSAPHLADDVTQIVFTDLAKKASTLSPEVVLAGWLHRHSYYLALNTARAENRRRHRERTAMEINDVNEGSLPAKHWLQLAPVLDAALDHLDTTDRDAIVLRYLQQRNLRSVGQTIGLSEDAAQKRVARALDKLRDILVQRGVTVTGVMLATELEASAGPVAVSPALAASISAHALNAAAVASTSLTFLSLKTMITSKLAFRLASAILVVGVAAIIISHLNKQSSPILSSATAASVSPAKSAQPSNAPDNNVEAPKLAAAPVGNAPATSADLAAFQLSEQQRLDTGFRRTDGQKSNMVKRSMGVHDGQMTQTMTKNGVTFTAICAAPPEGTAVIRSSDEVNNIMIIFDEQNVAYSVPTAPAGYQSRTIKMLNGQITVTTTQNGITTTTTGPAPTPDAVMTIRNPDGSSDVIRVVPNPGVMPNPKGP